MLANDNCSPDVLEEHLFARLHADPVLPYDKVRDWGAAHGYPLPPTQNSPCMDNVTQPTTEPELVKINQPDEGNQVSGVVAVNGVVRMPNNAPWVLEVGRAGAWNTIAAGNGEVHGRLGQFDSSAFGEGELDIRLTATNEFGQPIEAKVRVYIVNAPPPTAQPSPTLEPTKKPKKTKTPEPTLIIETPIPTEVPTEEPTIGPTDEPTLAPTDIPTLEPTIAPTIIIPVTETPTIEATATITPTFTPTP